VVLTDQPAAWTYKSHRTEIQLSKIVAAALIKAAVIKGTEMFGTGSGASPAIGGHFVYHRQLEKKIAEFYHRQEAILYTTGYTANSATLQCLLHKEDLAILDMAVHASVYEGVLTTNVKTFLHNNLEMLEQVLNGAAYLPHQDGRY